MSVLFAGGEDLDFPFGTAVNVTTTAGNFRAGFARCAVGGSDASGNVIKSVSFSGGNITSAWLSCRGIFWNNGGGNTAFLGFGNLGSHNSLGISINGSNNPIFVKISSGTITALGSAMTGITFNSTTINKFDLQMINYGVSGTLNLFINGAFMGSYTGDLTVPGTTGFNSVFVGAWGRFQLIWLSEFVVANESTLALQGVVTCAPNANGVTQQWSNPNYTNFNPTSINDANSSYVNLTAKDEQAGLLTFPVGPYTVKAVRVAARALATAGAGATQLRLGLNNTNNSTVAVGAANALSSGFTTVDQYFATDPTTGAAWGTNLTGYQLDLRSA